MSNLTISMRFAIDRDRNSQISREEVVGFSELQALDSTPDQVLQGRELEPVYFEYGKDVWLQAGRTHRLRDQNMTSYVTLQTVGLEPPRIEMKVDIQC